MEAFASAFSHYYDEYCSPFPDLEIPFGSKGSFFDMINWGKYLIFVNMPFDNSLILYTFQHICQHIDHKGHKFIFILPSREDYPVVSDILTHKSIHTVTLHKRGEMPFFDYMNAPNVPYYPSTDILEIIMNF